MVSTLDDTKRTEIATKLADMGALQNLLVSNEQKLIAEVSDLELRSRLENMLRDDQKNVGIIESVISQYGTSVQPKNKVQKFVEQTQGSMQGSDLTLYEKVSLHELLKHSQAMNGIVVHKAAQLFGSTLADTLNPLNTVNFENRAHQEQLKGMLEILGARELVGQDPDQGVWARVQDATAALKGVFGSLSDHT